MASPEGIAQAIAGGEPPEWMVTAIRKAAKTLEWSVLKNTEYPNREPLRKRLKTLADASEFIRSEMRSLTITTILLDGDDQFLNQNEMYHGLGDLEKRVVKALQAIPKRKGNDKYHRHSGLSLQENCALMILLVWKRSHGEAPPKTNKVVQEACAESLAAGWRPHRQQLGRDKR